jgi:hypothetical protein
VINWVKSNKLFTLTMVFVATSVGGVILQTVAPGPVSYVLLTVSPPMFMVILVAGIVQTVKWLSRKGKKENSHAG